MHKLLYLFSLTGIMVACQPQADPYPTSDVGYISPENRIDPDPEFEICGTESDIVQYYHGNLSSRLAFWEKRAASALSTSGVSNPPRLVPKTNLSSWA